jgi:hypothetical protein
MCSVLCILEIAGRGRTKRMSLRRLHALSWATRGWRHLHSLTAQLAGEAPTSGLFVSVDPALNAAVDLLLGAGLVIRVGGKHVTLSETGRGLAREIIGAGALDRERQRLESVRGYASETAINRLLKRR